ncbi:MAG: HAMP domain-containing protein [Deltaproteobacteria bacterium]|nr:HAMP domain-containing protein [Deltaproteobacteria bacterium]
MAAEQQIPYRRRIVYIHRPFQRSFIITMTATYRYHHLSLQETAQAILPAMIITNLVVLVGLLAATIAVTLYVSHKIAGPLYRLARVIDTIGGGDLTVQMKLRQRDQLKDLAASINQMTANLNERLCRLQTEVLHLHEKVGQKDVSQDEVREEVAKLKETIDGLFVTKTPGPDAS